MHGNKNYIDRRKHKRKDLYCLIKYTPYYQQEGPTQTVFTSLRNISGGGLLFKSNEYLPVGTRLDIAISVPAINKTVFVQSRVVRFEKNKNTKTYLVGVMFTDIRDSDRDEIIRLAETS